MTLRPLLLLACLGAFNGQQNREAEEGVKKLRPTGGLQISLVSAEPDFVNPVAFYIDEKGRFYVSETHRLGNCTYDIRGYMAWVDDDLACRTVADREAMHRKYMGAKYEKLTASERVRLLEDKDGDGRVDRAVTFAEGFGTPADGLASGVLARKGDVWFSNIPNLWHLKDTDGDGKADVRKSLHYGYGVRLAFIGHDLHGLRIGPDGKLYFTCGDRGVHVEQAGRVVSNPDSGCVLRCNLDGSDLEVFATGLRNPQELAFDAHGNLWTGDNNCDAGDKARWTYLPEGADCGWRIGYQQAPGRGPWMAEKLWELDAARSAPSQVPAVAHIGHGPSGLTYNGGLGLPAAYAGHFFMANFPGNILTWRVKAEGAGFKIDELRTFLGDNWATDVEIGNDGAVYVLDWVNGWSMPNKGRIYRVFDPALAKDPAVLEAKKIIAEGMEKRSAEELGKLLGHGDQRIRQEAQFELAARKDSATLLKGTVKDQPPLARLHAIWGLEQIGARDAIVPLLDDEDPEVRAQAAKAARAFDPLVSRLKDSSPRVRAFAAMSLGKLKKKETVAPILEMFREGGDAWLRHAVVMGLAGTGDAEALSAAARDESAPVRLAALLALRRMGHAKVALFLDDKDPAIVFEAARAINDAPIPAATEALAAKLGRGLPEKALNRAINAAFRTGDAAALGKFAASKEAPAAARAEALKALSEWEKPSGRDRILHVWRPLPPRDAKAAREVLAGLLPGLLKDSPAAVQEAAARAAGDLGMREAAGQLRELCEGKASVWVRIAALKALAALKHESLAPAVLLALEDKDPNFRKEGAKLLQQLRVPNIAALLEKLAWEEGPLAVRQSAIASAAQLPGEQADKILAPLLDALLSGKLPAGLALDVLDAAASRPSMRERIAKYESGRKKDDPLLGYRETLEGGDAEHGRKLFVEKVEFSCAKCHVVNDQGGEVGPELSKIGSQKSREYLLESMVLPNKDITQGFAQVLIQLKSDEVETGRIEAESGQEVVLLRADGSRKKIPVSDIKARKAGLSAMPEDLVKKMSRRDLRDIVEFLSSLK